MLYLHANDERPAIMHNKQLIFMLSMKRINTLTDNHSFVPNPGQIDILLFMALIERIPLTLHTLDSFEVPSSSVYIEGIDYLHKKLTISRTDSSISKKYGYVYVEQSHPDSSVIPLIV